MENKLIWIADDHVKTRENLESALRGRGFTQIESFTDGYYILERLEKANPNNANTLPIPKIIVMDTEMESSYNGITTLNYIRNDEKYFHAKKVYVIGISSDDTYKKEWLYYGAQDFFNKAKLFGENRDYDFRIDMKCFEGLFEKIVNGLLS